MEYTLDDAYETLKDKRAELEKHIEELIHKISNNEVLTISSSSSGEDVRLRQDQLEQNLLKEIQQMQPENYPIPRTSDLRTEVMKGMKEEIHSMQRLLFSLEERLSDIQENITYLKNKKSALEKMKVTYLDTKKTFANKTYENELILTKHMFQDVKNDLYTIVDTLFPDNEGFKDLLAALTSAYQKGGDNAYVDVTPNTLDYVMFLLEADIVQYHRNDKTKIKLTELL